MSYVEGVSLGTLWPGLSWEERKVWIISAVSHLCEMKRYFGTRNGQKGCFVNDEWTMAGVKCDDPWKKPDNSEWREEMENKIRENFSDEKKRDIARERLKSIRPPQGLMVSLNDVAPKNILVDSKSKHRILAFIDFEWLSLDSPDIDVLETAYENTEFDRRTNESFTDDPNIPYEMQRDFVFLQWMKFGMFDESDKKRWEFIDDIQSCRLEK